MSGYEYVGFWRRLLAAAIDFLILFVVTTPILLAIYGRRYFALVESGASAGFWDFVIEYIVPAVAVIAFWRRYGATMLGLMRHHAVDPHHFLRETHDFDFAAMLRAERGLARLFARLPGRKVLLTNAPDRYARGIVRELSLHRHIDARYPIERMRVHGAFRPKPSTSMLRHMLWLLSTSTANRRAAASN